MTTYRQTAAAQPPAPKPQKENKPQPKPQQQPKPQPKPQKKKKTKDKISRFKEIAALFAWLPIVGDLIAITLGFMRFSPLLSCLLMSVGRFARFAVVGGILSLV